MIVGSYSRLLYSNLLATLIFIETPATVLVNYKCNLSFIELTQGSWRS